MAGNMIMSRLPRPIGAVCAVLLTLGACKLAGPDDPEALAVRGPLHLLSIAPVQGNWLVTTNPPEALRTGVLPHIADGGVGGQISGNAYWWNVLESGEISLDPDQRFRLRLRYPPSPRANGRSNAKAERKGSTKSERAGSY